MNISPGSFPKKGILLKKVNNKPTPIKIIPKIINVFPISCIFLSLFLFPSKCIRNTSDNICLAP